MDNNLVRINLYITCPNRKSVEKIGESVSTTAAGFALEAGTQTNIFFDNDGATDRGYRLTLSIKCSDPETTATAAQRLTRLAGSLAFDMGADVTIICRNYSDEMLEPREEL